MKDKIVSLLERVNHDRRRLLDILLEIQEEYRHIPAQAVEVLAEELNLSRVDVEETITFYHFLTLTPAGEYTVYLNDSPVAYLQGRAEVARAFEAALVANRNIANSKPSRPMAKNANINSAF